MRRVLPSAIALAALVATAGAATEPAIRVDPRFGDDGRVVRTIGKGSDVARALARDARRRLVIAGSSGAGLRPFGGGGVLVLRLHPDGRPDRSFARNGVFLYQPARGNDEVAGVAVLPGGRILVGGHSENMNADQYADDSALFALRLTSRGRLDAAYGRGGIARVALPKGLLSNVLAGMAVARDGSVVVAAHAGTGVQLARFDARGRLDRSFGRRGLAHVGVRHPSALARQPDGKLVIAGMSALPKRDFIVVRLRPNGALDPSFGRRGIVVVSFGHHPDSADAVAVRGDGSILLAGHTALTDEEAPWCVAHCDALRLVSLTRDGRLETRFGRAGSVVSDVELYAGGGIALEPDGRGGFVVGTSTYAGGLEVQTTVLRIDRNGRLSPDILRVNLTNGRIGSETVQAAIRVGPGRFVLAGGRAKQRTGFDALIIYDVALLGVELD